MDILTYALARKNSGSGDGALTGLQGISINPDRQLVFDLGNGKTVTSDQPIPAAGENDIITAIINNQTVVQEALDIPAALKDTINAMKAITDVAVTSVTIPGLNGTNGEPIAIIDHQLQLPLASENTPGLIKGASISNPDDLNNIETENINKIYVNNDGTMSVYTLNVNRLIQTKGDELVIGDTTD